MVLDSTLNAGDFGPGLTSTPGPSGTRVMRHRAAWAARRDRTYHLGSTAAEVMNAVSELNRVVGLTPVRAGRHTVDSRNLPQLLWNVTAGDSDAACAGISADVRVLPGAAHGAEVTPPGPSTRS
ncbi:hypothetical protein ACFY30_18990 [Streptomyces sp. NPDC000345]|uniref:hypothetical protein n=1 Tax=Streptomyces sp. NPDC000345 TaxID=3364537 RepID=UPI0036BECA4C